MNLVSSWLSSSAVHRWYPLGASTIVKTLASLEAMVATDSGGVADWQYHYTRPVEYVLREPSRIQ